MVENVPCLKHSHDGLTIEGYSRAAVQTCWRVNELKLLFDVGVQPWDFMGTPTLFISHAHLDHIAALPAYVSRRRMMKMDPPVIYLPKKSVDPFYAILKLFSSLDRGRLPVELIGIEPGEEIELSRELVVTTAKAFHTVPAMSFLVWDRRKKLRPEFADLPGDQLRNLKMQGTEISREVRMPLVGYLGDSSPRGLDENPDMYLARILITEMTFLSPDHRKEIIHKNGHMHLDDYVERADRFQNEIIVAGHLSTRYNRKQAIRFVERAFPDWMNNRLNLFV